MDRVKTDSGIRMENTRLRYPSVSQLPYFRPVQGPALASREQDASPEPNYPIAKSTQAVDVSWYRMVVEVTLHDRAEPCTGLRYRVVHPPTQLLLDLKQLCAHPFADRFALECEVPIPVFPIDVGKAQKIERFGFSFSSPFPVLFGKPPELDPACFVRVQFQPELSQPFPEILQKAVCIRTVLESQHVVVRIADDNDFALRALPAPGIHPEVEQVGRDES
jgi:hypothetical protein